MNTPCNVNNVEILDSVVSLETITPSIAQSILANHTYKLQRPLDRRNYDTIEFAMQRGEFPIESLSLCESNEARRTDLIDGFHRLSVSADKGLTFRSYMCHQTVATEEEKRILWLFKDGGGRKRNLADYRPMTGDLMDGLNAFQRAGLEKATGILACRFSAVAIKKHSGLKVSTGMRLQLLEQYAVAAQAHGEITRRVPCAIRSKMTSGLVTALACAIIDAQEKIAVPFLESIANNDGLKKGDPRHTFFQELIRPNALNREVLKTMQRFGLCWHSHFDGEKRFSYGKLGDGVTVPLAGTDFVIGC